MLNNPAANLEMEVELRREGFTLQVALEVLPGETLVLVGPSGSGKSTCLRALCGLARPSRGRIVIGGRAVLDTARGIDLPPWRRPVSVVFQDFALFPHRTVMQNVLYGLRGVRDGRTRAAEWLRALGIEELAGRRPAELSGGQQQRVALARAAARDSDLLLLDEPFGSLDAATRRSVRGELSRFLQRARLGAAEGRPRSTLLVTHDFLDALTLGDRIAVLEEGRLTQVGTREEVLRRPRTPFLAELTGHNVLAGELHPCGAGADFRLVSAGPLEFHTLPVEGISPGPVFLAFGPQEVTLMPGQTPTSARNTFPAVIREIVPLPDRLRVHLDAGAPLMADVLRESAAALSLEEGARVIAAVKATSVEVYS